MRKGLCLHPSGHSSDARARCLARIGRYPSILPDLLRLVGQVDLERSNRSGPATNHSNLFWVIKIRSSENDKKSEVVVPVAMKEVRNGGYEDTAIETGH